MPIENRNITWKSVTRVGTMPKRLNHALTSAAGTPEVSSLPSPPMPGERMLTLIGSSMHQSSATSSKPCHLSPGRRIRSEEHTSELQSRRDLVCRLLLEKKKRKHRPTEHDRQA